MASASFHPFIPSPALDLLTCTCQSRGIGYHTVKHLARKGATVYLGSRSEEAGKAAVAQLEKEGIGKGKVIYAWCDFGTPQKAKETGEKLLGQIERLDIYGAFSRFRRSHKMED